VATGRSASSPQERALAIHEGKRWAVATIRQVACLRDCASELTAMARLRPTVYGFEQQIPFLELVADGRFCLMAARGLLRAMEFLDPPEDLQVPGFPDGLERRIRLLRNCSEHWEPDARSHGRFLDEFPGEVAGSYQWGPDGVIVGGASIDELEEAAVALLNFFIDLDASRFAVDGWPALRT
jgi:hypothetical protein